MNKFFVLICLILFACKCYSENNESESLNYILQSNEKIAYAALISLNEDCQNIFPEYNTYEPEEVFVKLSENDKQKIIKIIKSYIKNMADNDKKIFFKRVEKWILSLDQINVFFRLTCAEETISAFYYIFPDEDIFKRILKNRGVNPENVDAEFLGGTVSSAEMAHIQYVVLNRLSLLDQNDLIKKFKSIFEYFLD